MKRLIPLTCLAGLLAASCIIVDVEDRPASVEQESAEEVSSPAPTLEVAQNTEMVPEEEIDRPLIRYYEIADT